MNAFLCNLPACWDSSVVTGKTAGWHAVDPGFNFWTGYLFKLSGYFCLMKEKPLSRVRAAYLSSVIVIMSLKAK